MRNRPSFYSRNNWIYKKKTNLKSTCNDARFEKTKLNVQKKTLEFNLQTGPDYHYGRLGKVPTIVQKGMKRFRITHIYMTTFTPMPQGL